MDAETDIVESKVFRLAKRRKFARTRTASDKDDSEPQHNVIASPDNRAEAADSSLQGVPRLHKIKSRKNGIMFSNTVTRSSDPPATTDTSAIDPDAERIKAVSDRFVTHSGQVVDVDKHMFVLSSIQKDKNRK